jgi:hypothetical protein
LLSEEGTQYGPVTRPELDEWCQQGRITPRCQLLRQGAPAWQWATDIYPHLAQTPAAHNFATSTATPTAPQISFADPNPYASPSAGGKLPRDRTAKYRRSDNVNYVGLWNYAIGGLIVLGTLISIIRTLYISSQLGAPVGGTIGVFVALVLGMFSIPFLFAGAGVMGRRPWGRILTMILGVFTILLGLIILGLAALAAVVIGNANLPPDAQGRALVGCMVQLFIGLIYLGHGIFAYMILLSARYAKEFE